MKKQSISILIAMIIALTSCFSVAATEIAENVPEEDGTEMEVQSSNSLTGELAGGWTYKTDDADAAVVREEDGKCVLDVKRKRKPYLDPYISDQETVYSSDCELAYDVHLTFEGNLDSDDLFIKTDDRTYLDDIVKRRINEDYKYYNNSISINLVGDYKGGYFKKKIYIQQVTSQEVTYGGINTRLEITCGVVDSVLHFNLPDGLSLQTQYHATYSGKKDWNKRHETETIDGRKYYVYTISNYMDCNDVQQSANAMVGNYEIKYNIGLPSTGGEFSNFKAIGKGRGEGEPEDITISDKDGNVFYIQKAKLVPLKSTPGEQGAYPTVPNAAIQIMKVNFKTNNNHNYPNEKEKKRLIKAAIKELKKGTKVKKKGNWESQALPVIVYPYRLDDSTITLGGVTGKYWIEDDLNGIKKHKIVNGKKDSLKTGKNVVKYEDGILTVNSADAWSGPNGISENRINFQTKK